MITYEQFKELYDAIQGEPEFPLYFDTEEAKEYMIIKCDDGPTFQKCFGNDYWGELKFKSLDDLCHAALPNGICLERDWGKITAIYLGHAFNLAYPEDLKDCWDIYVPLSRGHSS